MERQKEKVKTAVAIAYEPGEEAPKILATGKGLIAERIIEKAKEEDVPFYKDSKLAATLSKLEIGDMIPPELYRLKDLLGKLGESMIRRKEGAYYENLVAEYLKTQGYEILEKNYRCRIGEIDLIAKEGETLVFVEVKYRRDDKMGNPKEAVDRKKQKKISMTAS